jgi:GDP-L-fucose synthase
MRRYADAEHVNVGSGEDLRIADLARLVCEVVGVEPRIEHDLTKPDGTLRKLLDVTLLRELGFTAKIPLKEGIRAIYTELSQSESEPGHRRQSPAAV